VYIYVWLPSVLSNFTHWRLDSVPVVHHTSIANLPESPDYNTVLKMLKDVSHFLHKQFMFIIHNSRALIPQYTVIVLIDVFLIVLCCICSYMYVYVFTVA
jgi:hypothetical protein